MHVKAVPEDNVTVPDGRHNFLHNGLAEEPLRVGDGRNLKRVEPAERRRGVLLVIRLVAVKARRQARERLQELRALDGLVALGEGAPRAAVGGRRAAEERGAFRGLLVDCLRDGFGLRLVGELGDLVKAVVDCLALGEAGEEAPGDDFAAVSAGAAELAVLVVGFVMPFEGPLNVSFKLRSVWRVHK